MWNLGTEYIFRIAMVLAGMAKSGASTGCPGTRPPCSACSGLTCHEARKVFCNARWAARSTNRDVSANWALYIMSEAAWPLYNNKRAGTLDGRNSSSTRLSIFLGVASPLMPQAPDLKGADLVFETFISSPKKRAGKRHMLDRRGHTTQLK